MTKSHGSVYIYDAMLNFITAFTSKKSLARTCNLGNETVKKNINSFNLLRGNWYFTDKLLFNEKLDTLFDPIAQTNFVNEFRGSNNIKTFVCLLDSSNGKMVKRFSSLSECCSHLDVHYTVIIEHIKDNKSFKGYIILLQ